MAALTAKSGLKRAIAVLLLAVLGGVVLIWFYRPEADDGLLRDRLIGPISADASGIVILGTSLSHEASWPDRLTHALTNCGLHPAPMTRITRPGAHSGWGLAQLDRVVAVRPAVVLIEFTINDADLRDGLWLEQSRSNHREIIVGLQEALPDTRLVLMSMSPARGLRGFLRPALEDYEAMLVELAAAYDLGFVDLAPRWRAFLANHPGSLPDGLHPVDQAATAVILPVLVPALARAWGQEACPD